METLDFINFSNGVKQGPVTTSGWKRSKERLLVLIERADKLDTDNLMTPDSGRGRDSKVNLTANSIQAVLDYAISGNRQLAGNHAFGVAVFSSTTWQQTIAALKPTKILLCGFRCSSIMLPDLTTLRYMQGNPVRRDDGITYCQTLPLDQLLYKEDNTDKDASLSDLLFVVARHTSNLVRGNNPESLAGIRAKPVMVDTIEKFDRLMAKQWESKEFAVDLETANLSNYANLLLTYQVAFDTDKGYILPIEHSNSPFDREEQKYIKRELRKLWATQKEEHRKTMVVFNGKFDLRILRSKLKLPVVHHHIYEVTAGEHLLDENIGILSTAAFRGLEQGSVKTPMGNLRNMFCMYGNDSYYTMPFSKEARTTISDIDITSHVEAQKYCVVPTEVVDVEGVGRIPIVEVTPGMRVLSRNLDKGVDEYAVVSAKYLVPLAGRRVITIAHESGTVSVTEDHKVWSNDRMDWVEAGKLIEGEDITLDSLAP